VLAIILFARPGKLSSLMEDMGKGIRGFRKGLSDQDAKPAEPAPQVEQRRETDRTGA
jgi:sec-independent protein translocase protein TatA